MSEAISAQDDVYPVEFPPPVTEVPTTEELPPVEDYSEESVPEPTEIDNTEEDTGQNIDTFA